MKNVEMILINMEKADDALHQDILARGEAHRGYHAQIRLLHESHIAQLSQRFETQGWPDFNVLSHDAKEALYSICIQGISRPDFMKSAFDYFDGIHDDLAKFYAAHLYDRIAFFERKKQYYGTQWQISIVGETILWLVYEKENLNARRLKMGLPSFESLDFTLIELDLSAGLKRQIEQYRFIYEVAWLDYPFSAYRHFLNLFADFTSGFIMGPAYSSYYLLKKTKTKPSIDIILPLQHRHAFDVFVHKNHIITTLNGRRHSTYAYKHNDVFYHFSAYFIAFNEGEDDWILEGLNKGVQDLTCHTQAGWLLNPVAIITGQACHMWNVAEDDVATLKSLNVL